MRTLLGLAALAVVLTSIPARAPEPSASGEHGLRVGLVFDVGGRGDKSFNDSAYRGVERARDELGVDVTYLEPEGAEDRESALRLFAARGYDLVLGVGFVFTSDVDAVARDYPAVRFACVDYAGSETAPNLAGLVFREEEGSFLVGAAAGLMSRSGHVGFVGGMVGPLIRRFEVGYRAGVLATCPSCSVEVGYAGTSPDAYRDPVKGKSLALAQIGRGADILYQAAGATGHGVFEAARERGLYAIGVDSDQYDEAPGTVLTSMIKRVDVAVFETVRAVHQGSFRGGVQRFGLREGGVDWIHEGEHGALIPEAVRVRVQALADEVRSERRAVPRD